MSKAAGIINPLGDYNENLQRVADAIGKNDGVKWRVFDVVYGRSTKSKSASQIAEVTGDSVQVVRNAANQLAHDGLIIRDNTNKGKEVLFGKQAYIAGMKARLKKLVGNENRISSIPTKRNSSRNDRAIEINVTVPGAFVEVKQITIDDIDSFSDVRRAESWVSTLGNCSEDDFKKGIQSIIGERATFKDWGGEVSDLMTTRVKIGGKRISAAFAFKGPGLRSKLVPGKMGKNGDQAQRLFTESAQLFVVQHWREIDPSVVRLMESLAIAKSVSTATEISYCVIDGNDSARIFDAYRSHFPAG